MKGAEGRRAWMGVLGGAVLAFGIGTTAAPAAAIVLKPKGTLTIKPRDCRLSVQRNNVREMRVRCGPPAAAGVLSLPGEEPEALAEGLIYLRPRATSSVTGAGCDLLLREAGPRLVRIACRPRPARVSLEVSPTAAEPGAQVQMKWFLAGDTAGQAIQVLARKPGRFHQSANGVLINPGAPPATGAVLYLRPDGSWDPAPAAYLSPAISGGATFALPGTEEGTWLLEAVLVNAAGAPAGGFGARTVLVAASPSLSLTVSRPIARTTDRVTARLATAPGAAPRPVSVAAWLVRPDGSEVSLPGLGAGMQLLHEGNAGALGFPLYDGVPGALGPGEYRFKARLADGATGDLLTVAEATVGVCDGPAGSLTGTVFSAEGQPLGGGAPRLAEVRALDVDAVEVVASAPVGADGAYALSVPPGRYLLSADVVDGAGRHEAEATQLAVVGCGGANLALDLRAAPPVAPPAAAEGEAPTLPGTGAPAASEADAPDGFPLPRVFYPLGASISLPKADFEFARDVFITDMVVSRSHAAVLHEGLAAIAQLTAIQLAIESPVDLEGMVQSFGTEFSIVLFFDRAGGMKTITATLFDGKTGRIIRRVASTPVPDDQEGFPDAVVHDLASRMLSLAGDPNGKPALFDLLRHYQRTPFLPHLGLSLTPDPAHVQPGATVTATATLRERNAGGAAQVGRPLVLSVTAPNGTTVDVDGLTGADGTFSTQFQAGDAPGPGEVKATYSSGGQVRASDFKGYRVTAEGSLGMRSPNVEVETGAAEPVTVSLRRNGLPVANAVVTLAAQRGTLDATQVTTDAGGQATFTFTAGQKSGLASVTAGTTAPPPAGPGRAAAAQLLSASLPLMVDDGVNVLVTTERPSVYGGFGTQVVAEVFVAGARAAGLPVGFAVNGAGALSAAAATTDADGRAAVDYTAPGAGSGSDEIVATVTVDARDFSGSATVGYEPAPCSQSVMWGGYEWQMCGSQTGMTWEEAQAYCANLVEGGHDDWALPTIEQLRSLIVCTNGTVVTALPPDHPHHCRDGNPAPFTAPTIDAAFSFPPGASSMSYMYYSATTTAANPDQAWCVVFLDGYVEAELKTHTYFARCVR